MTVSSPSNKIIYSGNGSTTSFPFSFSTPTNPADIQVFFTAVNGTVTQLTQGPSSAQYQLALNPVTGTNPTPVGGTVTYNPLGTPIPSGSQLTIVRQLPITQNFSLANQGTSYQSVTEQALDYGQMTAQQIQELQARCLAVPVSDPNPLPLPNVTQRATLFLAFDSSGNPIAAAPSGANAPVSSAMQPVVNAATLALARTALGLGTIATESIGLGLADNGAGAVQTVYPETTDATSQSVAAAFHQTIRSASVAVTYTLPLSSTLFNGFGFFVYASGGAATLAPNAADRFDGAGVGASLTVPAGSRVFVSTNGAGTWYISGLGQPGFNAPLNMTLVASVAGSALTIALKDAGGNDPSAASPIIYVVSANGNSQARAITGPLSITVPSGATIDTVSGQASRLWVGVFDGPGGPVLGVWNAMAGLNVVCWDETTAQNTTAISAGSSSPAVWYTQGSSLSGRAFRIFGYVESTQPTAGTWSVAPSKVQLFGPGQKKPGDRVQVLFTFNVASAAISPQSAANLVRFAASVQYGVNAATVTVTYTRGATTLVTQTLGSANSAVNGAMASSEMLDQPNTTGATTYSQTVTGAISTAAQRIVLEEIFA